MNKPNLYITFLLDDRSFALAVNIVERVIHAVEITPLPDSSKIKPGVINMEGEVISVMNIRGSLNMAEREISAGDRFIIVNTARRRVVLIADSVDDILKVPDEDMVKAEMICEGLRRITGAIRANERVVPILDIDQFYSLYDKNLAFETAQTQEESVT